MYFCVLKFCICIFVFGQGLFCNQRHNQSPLLVLQLSPSWKYSRTGNWHAEGTLETILFKCFILCFFVLHFNTQEGGGCRCSVHCRKGEGQAIALFSIPASSFLYLYYQPVCQLVYFCVISLYLYICVFFVLYICIYLCTTSGRGSNCQWRAGARAGETASLASAAPRIPPPAPPP